MATINQLCRRLCRTKKKFKNKTPALEGNSQKKGTCINLAEIKPITQNLRFHPQIKPKNIGKNIRVKELNKLNKTDLLRCPFIDSFCTIIPETVPMFISKKI